MIIYQYKQFMTSLIFFLVLGGLFAQESDYEGPPEEENSIRFSSFGDETILLNDIPFQIISGSIHYFRVPAPYWQDRLHKLKAAGLNTVSTYVEWSYHEPEKGQFKFSGDHDVAHFIRLAEAEGLYVLLRVGPYICAQRDLGGLPYWLLSMPDLRLRVIQERGHYIADEYCGSNMVSHGTAKFIQDVISHDETATEKLQIKPLLYANGGPIIMMQIENEYSHFGTDRNYMNQLRVILGYFYENKVLFYTTDSFTRHSFDDHLDGVLPTISFGSDQAVRQPFKTVPQPFDNLRKSITCGPLMNSEFYSGWLTHWGEAFQRGPRKKFIYIMRSMLNNNISFNIYMFHGGTNFEFSAGANHQENYQPYITSYDNDAPLSESGDPTPKYFDIRRTMEEYVPDLRKIPLPSTSPKYGNKTVYLKHKLHLLSPEGREVLGKVYPYDPSILLKPESEDPTWYLPKEPHLPTFEALRQRSGLVLYESSMRFNKFETYLTYNKIKRLKLTIKKPRDRVYVFIDGEPQGVFSRMLDTTDLIIEIKRENKLLSLLVENQGRINYGPELHDYKGLLSPVYLNFENILVHDWKITGFPLDNIDFEKIVFPENSSIPGQGPALYEGSFILPKDAKPLDTFLSTAGWGKGYVWVNGHNLGRYWPRVGPQVTLYVPGVWLRAAPETNSVHLLELELTQPTRSFYIKLIDHPILDDGRHNP